MARITVDFETRSTSDLLREGAWKYSMDPNTDVFCLAFAVDDQDPGIWVNPYFENIVVSFAEQPLKSILGCEVVSEPQDILKIDSDAIYEAHNAEFERVIWRNVLMRDFDVDEIPTERWRCSAAKAAAMALPRKLERAVMALGLSEEKDMEGHRIMQRLSKPKPSNQRKKGLWDETPEKLVKLFKYCLQDIRAERALSQAIPDLSDFEQRVWVVDQNINERGICVDVDAVDSVIAMVDDSQGRYKDECVDLCGHKPSDPNGIRRWIEAQGYEMPDLTKARILDMLETEDLDADVEHVMRIRLEAGKASTKKYNAMRAMVCPDGRVRGTLLFNAASTGRWGGKGIQPHNMLRKAYKDIDDLLFYVRQRDYDAVEMMWDEPMTAASVAVRGMLTASPGNQLIDADWSSIEARILAWLAGERHILNAFRSGEDTYKLAAQAIFPVPLEAITGAQRQIGKVVELSGGYQGSWRAFRAMAKGYGVHPPGDIVPEKEDDWYEFPQYDQEGELIRKGARLSFRDACYKKWAMPIVKAWRAARPRTQMLWSAYEQAALKAVEEKGKTIQVGEIPIYFAFKRDFLQIRLPSGRRLSYYDPQVRLIKTPWGEAKEAVTFMGVDSMTKQWKRMAGYGGEWTENIVQAVAADLLRVSLVRLDDMGFPVVFHVHDEIVGDCDTDEWKLDDMLQVMTDPPPWAKGLPLEADGWVGFRYRK